MSKKYTWRGLSAASLLSMTLFGVGCAQSVSDIDRTQPNMIKKADFNPGQEWYYRQMVSDSDLQGSIIFQGYQSSLKRIKWVVTEGTLFACSTMPPAVGKYTEEMSSDGCYGNVAAFPILGHFDVQRSYNTATGEQSNVIVENASDRPWYDREFMRVDWSRNMVDGFGMFGSNFGQFSSASWNIDQDPGYADPDRARIDAEGGYIEATTVHNYRPDIYACYDSFGYDGIFNCEAGQLRLRNSFVKVPDGPATFEPFLHLDSEYLRHDDGSRLMVTQEFDPEAGLIQVECNKDVRQRMLDVDGNFAQEDCRPLVFDYFTRFGFFRTEYADYDAVYGNIDDTRQYYADHWQIWQTAYDESGELLDAKDRAPKPIVYHLNPEYPRDMIEASQEVARQWDIAFKDSVALAKGYGATKEGREKVAEELEAAYGDARMFKIEENTCMPQKLAAWIGSDAAEFQDGDRRDVSEIVEEFVARSKTAGVGSLEDQLWGVPIHDRTMLCSEIEYATELRDDRADRFTWERDGDLRYSFFSWVEELGTQWYGYGPSAADPRTGQIISGSANISGNLTRIYGGVGADMVRFMNGDLTDEQMFYGDQVTDYLKQVDEQSDRTMSQELSPEGKAEFVQRTLDADPNREYRNVEDVSAARFARKPTIAELPEIFRQKPLRQIKQQASMMAKAAQEASILDTRFMDFMSRPDVKALMLGDSRAYATVEAMARELAADPTNLTEEDLHLAYLNMNTPEVNAWRSRRRDNFLASRNVLSSTQYDRLMDSMVITYRGSSEYFKGKTLEEISNYFMRNVLIGTQLHEVGHSVGLRHNFISSLDALNYHDEFWLVQKAIAEGVISENEANSIPKSKFQQVLGEYYDEEEHAQRPYLSEAEYRVGSVMDYTRGPHRSLRRPGPLRQGRDQLRLRQACPDVERRRGEGPPRELQQRDVPDLVQGSS